jgi:hypothetical protein
MDANSAATITNLSAPTNNNDAARKIDVDNAVANLVDSAPDSLNTLNELAAALADDDDAFNTLNTAIGTKLPKAGGTMTGAIAMSANKITGVGDPTAAQDVSSKAYVDQQDALQVTKSGDSMSGNLAMGSNNITGLATPTANDHAVNKSYADNILGSATAAATSASNAATSESNAATSETNAASSASAAAADRATVASLYDSFDDRYLGPKSSAPTQDNDGNALVIGALYFNSTNNIMYVYGSGGWQAAGSSVNGTSDRQTYTATAGQTVFAATYDAGYVDVYLNGVKLLSGTDFTATNGTSITLASGAAVNDVVDIVAYGTFVLADHLTQTQSDARYVNLSGDTMTGDLSFGDNDKAIFGGATSELQIYSDGSNSRVHDTGTGGLRLMGSEFVALQSNDGENMVVGTSNGAATLYYDNAAKLATTSTGISVTGNATFGDNEKAIFGAGSDLSIFHNGSSSLITDSGTGGLTIRSNLLTVQNAAGNETVAQFVEDGFVKLFHNNSQVLTTTATGIDTNGVTVAGNLSVDGGTIKLDGNYPVGTQNTALGDAALDDGSLSGGFNTAIGRASLSDNTSGSYNSALGNGSLQDNETGTANTAVGYNALTSNTASYNVAVGHQALEDNTSGNYLTAVGQAALGNNTSGIRNSALGRATLGANTTGNYNSAFGYGALADNQTHSNNTAMGYQALTSTTADNNTAVGYQAGYSNTTNASSSFFGHTAGYSTTGTRNTFLGQGSGYWVSSGTKNTILGPYDGNQGGLDIRTSDNNIVLSDGDGNPQFYIKGDTGATKFVGDGRSDSGAPYGGVIAMAGRTSNIGGAIASTQVWHKIFHRSFMSTSSFGHAIIRIEVLSNGETDGSYSYGNIIISTKQQSGSDYYKVHLKSGCTNMFNRIAYKFNSTGGTQGAGSLEVYFKPKSYCHTELFVNINRDYMQDTQNGYVEWNSTGSTSQPASTTLITAAGSDS